MSTLSTVRERHQKETCMNQRSTFKSTAIAAASAALTALAAFGAHAVEATQWNPQAGSATTASLEASATHTAWATDLGEATQFHDAVTRDTMASRADVKADLKMAKSRGLMNDTGEGGASDRVLAQREAFVHEEHDRLMALNDAQSSDPIGEMISAMAPTDDWFSDTAYEAYTPDSFEVLSMAEYMPQDFGYAMPNGSEDRAALTPGEIVAMR
jgi:hypothetical protein